MTATFTVAVTPGNLIVATAANYNGGSATAKDLTNNVAFNQAVYQSPSALSAGIWWYVAPLGGASFTVQVVASNSAYPSITIEEFGVPPSSIITLDNALGAAGNSGTPTLPGNLTVTGNDLVVFTIALNAGSTYTPGSGFVMTPFSAQYAGAAHMGIATEYQLGVIAPINPTLSLGTSQAWTAAGAAFKVSAVGGSSPVPVLSRRRGV